MITYEYYRELIKAKAGSKGLDIHDICSDLAGVSAALNAIQLWSVGGEYADDEDSDEMVKMAEKDAEYFLHKLGSQTGIWFTFDDFKTER